MNSETKNSSRDGRLSLADEIIRCGKQTFDPSVPEEIRLQNKQTFDLLLEKTSTLTLLPVLNYLVQPGRIFSWLQKPLISNLAQLPLRAGGVQDTIEFILSIHPSTANSSPNCAGRRPPISHEALNAVSRLISSPPAGLSPDTWFNGIAPQLLSLLQGEQGCDMYRVAAYIIGFGILGRKQYGAPGSSGWKAFVEPIHEILCPLDSGLRDKFESCSSPEIIERVGFHKIYSTPTDIANSLKSLSNLVTSHPHPSLTNRVLRPILYTLWTLSCWPNGTEQTENSFRVPARNLMICLLQLSLKSKEISKTSLLDLILDEYISKGQSYACQRGWSFVMVEDGGIQIEKNQSDFWDAKQPELMDIDIASDKFIELLREHSELETEVSALFMRLISKWLTQDTPARHTSTLNLHRSFTCEKTDTRIQLVEAKIMQKLMTVFPERLVDNSTQLLNLVHQILKGCCDSGINGKFDQDAVSTILSLLNHLITSPNFRISPDIGPLIGSIKIALESLSKKNIYEVSRTSGNLLMLLTLHDTVNPPQSVPSDKEILKITSNLEDRKTYNLALSYISAPDSPPPVRVQGLELLSCLFRENSPILDIPALIQIVSSLLDENEEYVHLRAINLLVQVAQRHHNTVTRDILDRYFDSNEEYELDTRLRLGEALQQIIQICNSSLKLETTESLCQALLFLGGRRGYRRKTEIYQEKARHIKEREDQKAEEAWGGPVPQLDEDLESDPENRDILLKIVSGWESKRGTEDVRIRSSAITILGTAILSNIQRIRSQTLSAALDLSIHILTIERDIEKGILRRAAVVLIINFIRALDSARNEGRCLGFGILGQGLKDVQKILDLIEKTDNDNLVRQHSRDAIENLKYWAVKSLFPRELESCGIENLSGLILTSKHSTESCAKPKIEELD